MNDNVILEAAGLKTSFFVKRGGKRFELRAVDDVSFDLHRGEILGVVGETGCGKTTVGRSLVGLAKSSGGTVTFGGENILAVRQSRLRAIRLKVRMIFQDPYASLNPRRTIGDSVAEAGDIHNCFSDGKQRAEQIARTLDSVGLDPSFAGRFPHELSGGQRQRVGIARAILPTPDIVIADEPVSALDVSIQAQVLNLLMDLRKSLQLTIMFISHDLSVIGQISDRIAVMYLGRIVEMADAGELFSNPAHPYTQALIAAIPKPDPSSRISADVLRGEPPSRLELRDGCPYSDRCPISRDICLSQAPPLQTSAGGRLVACHFPGQACFLTKQESGG